MTTQDLIDWFGSHQNYVLGYFAVILVLAIVANVLVNRKTISSVKYMMSALVYTVMIPGILAVLLILYNLLILERSLLNVSIVAYFVPVAAMVLTLLVLNRKVKMSQLPGFGRLSGLIVIISIAFMIIFVLQKTYFGILILGGMTQVLLVFGVLFVVIRFAWLKFTK